jgi:hypothetical protein
MKKFVTLGAECVEYWKAAKASEGNSLSYTFACLECLSLLLLFDFLHPLLELHMLWKQLMLAFFL